MDKFAMSRLVLYAVLAVTLPLSNGFFVSQSIGPQGFHKIGKSCTVHMPSCKWHASRSQRTTRTQAGVSSLRAVVFEPQAPPLGATASMIAIFALGAYWWLVFVPSERRDLAVNKNKGGLNTYLDALEGTPQDERKLEKWFYSEWLVRRQSTKQMLDARAKAESKATGENVDVVLARLMDAEAANRVERSKAMPSFMSLDNPLIVVALLLSVGVAVASSGR